MDSTAQIAIPTPESEAYRVTTSIVTYDCKALDASATQSTLPSPVHLAEQRRGRQTAEEEMDGSAESGPEITNVGDTEACPSPCQ